MGSVQNQKFPQWVIDMINAEFYTSKGRDPNYRAYFCVDCGGKSLRKIDVVTQHIGHNVLQALTCSRDYGYNIYDVLKIPALLDVTGVCPYKVNTGFVFFPKSRKKGNKRRSCFGCVVCGADLPKPTRPNQYRFCSILCKFESGSESIHSKMLQKNEVCLEEKSVLKNVQEGCQKSECCSLKLKIKLGVGITKADETDDQKHQKHKKHQKNKKKKRRFDDIEKGQNQENKKRKVQKSSDNESDKIQNKDNNLEKLISAVLEDEKNISLSFRKKSRKGIPCRAPLF